MRRGGSGYRKRWLLEEGLSPACDSREVNLNGKYAKAAPDHACITKTPDKGESECLMRI